MQQIYTTHRGRIHNPVSRAFDCRAGGGGFDFPNRNNTQGLIEDVKIVTSISAFMQNRLTLKISAFVVKLPTLFCSIDLLEMIMNTSCG